MRDDGAPEWADVAASREPARTSRAQRATPSVRGASAAAPALPPDVATAIRGAASTATAIHRSHLVERTETAVVAFERGRFLDALRAVKPVADEVPEVAGVRELAGLAAYRAGRWREAVRQLLAFEQLTGSTEHLPLVMDSQRALHKPAKVAELWRELRQSSPDADVLAEGRIVAAASLADAGDLNGAISMLASAGASKALRNPSSRHVRQWYVLADLYERAGDVPRAREYFERVLRADPEAYDVTRRLAALGPGRRRSRHTRAPRSTTAGSRQRTRAGRTETDEPGRP